MRRHEDWLRQARRDLRHAQNAVDDGDFEWACFAAHQAGEKAVKALLHFHGIDSWGHSLTFLLTGLPPDAQPGAEIVERAKQLDKHYIPPRYPDAHPGGAPMDYYTQPEAESAVSAAREVLRFVESRLSATGSAGGAGGRLSSTRTDWAGARTCWRSFCSARLRRVSIPAAVTPT